MQPVPPRLTLPASAWTGPPLRLGGRMLDPDSPLFDPAAQPAPLAVAAAHGRRRLAWRGEVVGQLLAIAQQHADAIRAPGPGRGDGRRQAQVERLGLELQHHWRLLFYLGPTWPGPLPGMPCPSQWCELRLRPCRAIPRALEGLPFAASAAAAAAAGLPVIDRARAADDEVSLWAASEGALHCLPVAVSGQLPWGDDGRPRAAAAAVGAFFGDYARLEEACLKLAGAAGAPAWRWDGGGNNDLALAGALAALTGGRPFSLSCADPDPASAAFVRAYLDAPQRPAVMTFAPASTAPGGGPTPMRLNLAGGLAMAAEGFGTASAPAGDIDPSWVYAGVPHALLRRLPGSPRLAVLDPLRLAPDPVAWYGLAPQPAATPAYVELERSSLAALGARLWGVL